MYRKYVLPIFPLRVFYDGSCRVCASEMEAYSRKDAEGRLVFIDISAPGFDPLRHGRTKEEFMRRMHAVDAEGRVYAGADAFPAIWRAFPSSSLYGLMGRVITLPGVRLLARAGYAVFARLRRHLPEGA